MNIERTNIPEHIAIIMDGNGTWSKKNNLHRKDGHKEGVINAKKIIIRKFRCKT